MSVSTSPDLDQPYVYATGDRLLTVDEAAEYLGVKPRMIRRLVGQKRITHVHIGKHLRLPLPVLQQFIKDNTFPILTRESSSNE